MLKTRQNDCAEHARVGNDMASMYAFGCQRERLQRHVAHGKQSRPLTNLPTYKKRDAAQRCIPFAKIVVAYVFSKRREDSLSSFRLRVCVR